MSLDTVATAPPRLIDGEFRGADILSIQQFEPSDLAMVHDATEAMRTMEADPRARIPLLAGHVVHLLFLEPSSRTRGSFDTAAKMLGGDTITTDVGRSSVQKGEDLPDTLATFATQGDVLVIRSDREGVPHFAAGHIQRLSEQGQIKRVPVVNAGDGFHEHPTQALLDTSWIRRHFGRTNGLTATVVGDAERYRAHHSNILAMARLGMKVNIVTMNGVELPDFVREDPYVQKVGLQQSARLEDFLPETDVVYMGRRPKEYNGNSQDEEKRARELIRAYEGWVINAARMRDASPNAVVLHPLPRGAEIDRSFDGDPRAQFIAEMRNGIPTRKALLGLITGNLVVRAGEVWAARPGLEQRLSIHK